MKIGYRVVGDRQLRDGYYERFGETVYHREYRLVQKLGPGRYLVYWSIDKKEDADGRVRGGSPVDSGS